MIELLVWVLVLMLVGGLIVWIIQQIPLPPPFGNIAMVIVGVILILLLISFVLPMAGPRLR